MCPYAAGRRVPRTRDSSRDALSAVLPGRYTRLAQAGEGGHVANGRVVICRRDQQVLPRLAMLPPAWPGDARADVLADRADCRFSLIPSRSHESGSPSRRPSHPRRIRRSRFHRDCQVAFFSGCCAATPGEPGAHADSSRKLTRLITCRSPSRRRRTRTPDVRRLVAGAGLALGLSRRQYTAALSSSGRTEIAAGDSRAYEVRPPSQWPQRGMVSWSGSDVRGSGRGRKRGRASASAAGGDGLRGSPCGAAGRVRAGRGDLLPGKGD